MPFDSPDIALSSLLDDVSVGKIQLPDFQRPWKWDNERISSLLASIAQDHPVGVVMMLETGGGDINFKPRCISGAAANGAVPDRLLLDGQQRLTSLFQSLRSGSPVETFDAASKKKLKRWYYVDIEEALQPDGDLEDAILAVPEDRIIRTNFGKDVEADYSTVEKECAADVFPLRLVFDMPSVFAWQNTYLKKSPHGAEATNRWAAFYEHVLGNFVKYTVPVIVLTKETPKEAVCTVFEKVNTGGVVLNVFELLTATFAADDFRLGEDWDKRQEKLQEYPSLRDVQNTDFLQAVSLIVTARRRDTAKAASAPLPAVSCRRKDILRLTLDEYRSAADAASSGFAWAAKFLARQKIFAFRDVPYRTQLVPLAAIHAVAGVDLDSYEVDARIQRWYWCGVFGELYGGATETRFARDVEEVPAWVRGGPTPRTVSDASFERSRLLTLRTRNSAAYKGIYAQLMKGGCRDWMKNVDIDVASFFHDQLDIHHVFPHKWCLDHGVEPGRRDSIVNKTPLSYDTNRSIGGRPPKEYLATIEKKTGRTPSDLDETLALHACDAEAMRADDFETFFKNREAALASLVSAAMGKEVVNDTADPSAPIVEYEPDESEIDVDVLLPELLLDAE